MTVIVLTAVPPGLRGHLTRWLLEVSPGVFVGRLSARVRERLWQRVVENSNDGTATMVHTARNEQHFTVTTANPRWDLVDFEGVTLVRRPTAARRSRAPEPSWSADF